MLDPKLIRTELEQVAIALKKKGYAFDVKSFNELEAQRKQLQIETENLQNERNARSKNIGKVKASGGDIQPLINEMNDIGANLDALQGKIAGCAGRAQ